jgi:hypothetical protein
MADGPISYGGAAYALPATSLRRGPPYQDLFSSGGQEDETQGNGTKKDLGHAAAQYHSTLIAQAFEATERMVGSSSDEDLLEMGTLQLLILLRLKRSLEFKGSMQSFVCLSVRHAYTPACRKPYVQRK